MKKALNLRKLLISNRGRFTSTSFSSNTEYGDSSSSPPVSPTPLSPVSPTPPCPVSPSLLRTPFPHHFSGGYSTTEFGRHAYLTS
ncbi:unnamed protein product [Arabidopsis halleri]